MAGVFEKGGGRRVPAIGRPGASALLGFTIAIVLASFSFAVPGFLNVGTLLTIGQQTAVIAICAYPMTALVIARGIDLSIGANLAFGGIVAAKAYAVTQSGTLAILAALLCCAVGGGTNGMLVGYAGIAPFMATLATMAIMRGATLLVSGAASVQVVDPTLLWAGSSSIQGIPVALAIALVLAALWVLLMTRTVLGRWIYAVGGNEGTAKASLVPVRRVQLTVYVLSGLSAGLCSIIMIGRLGSAQPLAGMGVEFAAVTAAMVGGASLAGGQGSILPTLLGATLLGVVSAGLTFLRVPQEATYVVTAFLLLGSTALTTPGLSLRELGRVPSAPKPKASAPLVGRTLRANGLAKSFGGVPALRDGSLVVRSGRVLGLVGENGAGKSTLVKCLTGVQAADRGSIEVDGEPLHRGVAAEAKAAGIVAMHQHFSLMPDLTVAENLLLSRPPGRWGFLDRRRMLLEARQVLETVGLAVEPSAKVETLTVGQRQLVEIAKAILSRAWLIIMDEPTSALSVRERDTLFGLVRSLTERGCAVVYISHKLDEVFALCDEVAVLRDGATVRTGSIGEFTPGTLVECMVGRKLDNVFAYESAPVGDVVLVASGVGDGALLRDASLELRSGETVGICGLMGSGRTELLRCLAGLVAGRTGSVVVLGTALPAGEPYEAHARGVVYLPEDRHAEGFVGQMSVADNLALVWMRGHGGAVSPRRVAALAKRMIADLGIRPADPGKSVKDLSGGNQQKVVLGKWLAGSPKVLLLDEPTNGVDVGAKSEIHKLVARCKREGAAVLMVSSELPEILGVSDRILVMAKGRIVGELPRGASERDVMSLAFGVAGGSTWEAA